MISFLNCVKTSNLQTTHYLINGSHSSRNGQKSNIKLPLLILGSLQYLGHGWTFDNIEESISISKEVHRQFFHAFIGWGSSFLFKKMVVSPSTADEAMLHMLEMRDAGLNGCIRSKDATHVPLNRRPIQNNNLHKEYKMCVPACTYNIVVNYRRSILSTTTGHPARWNDKSLVLSDNFIRNIWKGRILQDNIFELLEQDTNTLLVKSVR